jgi:CRISPR-associated protein Csh1
MINKVSLLGDYVINNLGDDNPLGLNTDLKEANVILLKFNLNDSNCEYTGIDSMEYNKNRDLKKLLPKNAPGQVKSDFPTYFISKSEKAINASFNKLSATINNNSNINEELNALEKEFTSQSEMIKNSLSNYFDKEKSNLISIKINNDFIGDSKYYENIISLSQENKNKDLYEKYNTISKGNNNQCYICKESKKELYGFVSTFNFYSSNEDAYIAGGFRKENSWQNYPVCPECAEKLNLGKGFLEKNLKYRFYGFDYFLLPAPIRKTKAYEGMLEYILDDYNKLELKQSKAEERKNLTDAENEIFELLANQKNISTFSLFFYKETNSEFKILKEAEDILPSRFKKIFDVKKWVENFEEFHNIKGIYNKGEIEKLKFNFSILRTFFYSKFNSNFLDITSKIFKDEKLDKQFILHRISDHIAELFRQEKLYYEPLKAFMLIKFLYKLNLISNEKLKMEVKMNDEYKDYFSKHPDFFDADIKKAIFLEGILIQKLLNIQWRERNARPFRSRLNGMKIDTRVLKRLLPEAIEKLEQYKSNYYSDLENLISHYLISGETDLKKMTIDEISFYFVMGMNLTKVFKFKEEGANDEQSN